MGGAKNCPETPRQRMIGMMYLVLTAMLALNVSTDILNGFTLVDNSLHSSIEATKKRNDLIYRNFKAADAQNHDKVGSWYEKALELQVRADSLYNYIQDFKTQIVILADGQEMVQKRIEETGDGTREIQGNSNLDVAAQYAIVQGNGQKLKEVIAFYRTYLEEMSNGNVAMENQYRQMFATERGWNAHEQDSCDWEVAIFDGMPVGACITILTKIQNDVRASEGQMAEFLMGQSDAGDLRVNKLDAYVIPKSDYVIRGGKYSAQIILAAIDSTQTPDYYVEGQKLSSGLYEVVASGTGVRKFKGQIGYTNPATGQIEFLPFESQYTVGEPSVTISNNDLNIMYRGYDNMFSISVPGVSNDKVKVSVTGASCSQKGADWVIKPNESAKTVTISVSAELDGKMQAMGSRDYRVKALPKPGAYFKSNENEFQEGNIARAALLNQSATIIASYGPDGLLDLPFKITSFKMNINGTMTEAKSDRFTADQRGRLEKLKKGAMVVITDVRAKGPDGKEVHLNSIPLTLN